MIGREADAVGKQHAFVYDALVPFRVDKPHLLVRRIAEVDLAARVYRQLVRINTSGDPRFRSVRRVRHNTLPPVLAYVEAAVRSEHEAVRLAGILAEKRDVAIDGDLVDTAVRDVAEEHVSHRIDRR